MLRSRLFSVLLIAFLSLGIASCSTPLTDVPGGAPTAKISYSVLNQEPAEDTEGFDLTVRAPANIEFDASSSEGSIADYRWYISGREVVGKKITQEFNEVGVYLIRLLVIDENSEKSDVVLSLNVLEAAAPEEPVTDVMLARGLPTSLLVEFYLAHPTAVRVGREFKAKVYIYFKQAVLFYGWEIRLPSNLKLTDGKLRNAGINLKQGEWREVILTLKAEAVGLQPITGVLSLTADGRTRSAMFFSGVVPVLAIK